MSLAKSTPPTYGASPRVNLLPPLERQRREQAALIRRWGTIAAAAAVLMVLAVVVTMLLERSARGDLESERARTTALAGRIAAYHDVATATRDRSAYRAYRAEAMSSDVVWTSVIGALQAALPKGASVTGFDAVADAAGSAPSGTATGGTGTTGGTSGGAAGDAGAAGQAAPSGTAVTVSVQVSSMQPLDQRAMIARFGRVPGVLGADMGSLSSASSASYSSTTAVFFDGSVLSRTYAKAAR